MWPVPSPSDLSTSPKAVGQDILRSAVRVLSSWPALWVAFALTHAWIIFQAWVFGGQILGDVNLYEWWVRNGMNTGSWPVFTYAWVYPLGALGPMTIPALFTDTTPAYDWVWMGMVTAANAGAVALLGRAKPHGRAAVWFWLFFLVMLGPIWIGRLDGLLAPIILVALLIAARRPALAMALATVGAWIKIAPGAVALALAATASDAKAFLRNVVLPGAAVSAVVIGIAFAGGGQDNVLDVFGEQGDRQLQVEAVAATPFTVARLWDSSIQVEYDDVIFTYEVLGDGADAVAQALDVALPVAALLIAALIWWAARRRPERVGDILLVGAAAELLALIVFNKVGSPQFIAWIGPPVAAAIALGSRSQGTRRTWFVPAVGTLVVARLTMEIYPLRYGEFLGGWPLATSVGALRNVLLVALLVGAIIRLSQLAFARKVPTRTS
ncbi:glycosyltransferase 87 family protein [Promicromonospora sp. MEB111]|uniref:glycosyltransferase 87 family protein n=1 Tax=Promicromonospora sp. MEB111 TaxID=3040301 RepID=UPI00254C70E1|nr:glycosyltransferase 87 family protein [Promicromonospora sp. MEB111]